MYVIILVPLVTCVSLRDLRLFLRFIHVNLLQRRMGIDHCYIR